LRRLADEDEQLWAKLRAAYCDGLDAGTRSMCFVSYRQRASTVV
jgi:hypothetical protein